MPRRTSCLLAALVFACGEASESVATETDGAPAPCTALETLVVPPDDHGFGILRILTQDQLEPLRCVERIEGDLSLGILVDDLRPLSNLREVTRALSITQSAELTDLHGLEALESVHQLIVANLPRLSDLGGLSGLSHVGLSLDFSSLPSLTTLRGLPERVGAPSHVALEALGITSLEGLPWLGEGVTLRVDDCDALVSLEGLVIVGTRIVALQLSRDDALTSLVGLEGLESIHQLTLRDNTALASLAGLDDLGSVTSVLEIRRHPALTELTGLEALARVGSLYLDDVDLASLAGLDALTAVESDLHLCGHDDLSALDLPALQTVGETLTVIWNPGVPTAEVDRLASATMPATTKSAGNADGPELPLAECPWPGDGTCDAVLFVNEQTMGESRCDAPPCCSTPQGLCAEGTDDVDCVWTG